MHFLETSSSNTTYSLYIGLSRDLRPRIQQIFLGAHYCTSWAPTSYTWRYNPYNGLINVYITCDITPLTIGIITAVYHGFSGAHLVHVQKSHFQV